MHACGLNFADTLMAAGRYQEKPALPFAPGLEVCGTVAALGPGVAGAGAGHPRRLPLRRGRARRVRRRPGRRAAPPVPDGDAATRRRRASSSPTAPATSRWPSCARLRPGETLLVTGAAGGVGLTAVELGALMGARVIAVARGAEKRAVAAAAGAPSTARRRGRHRAPAVKALGGADVVYDTVGGALFDACLRAARPGARLLPIGFAGGEVPRIPANRLLVKNQTVIGFYFGAWVRAASGGGARQPRGAPRLARGWGGCGRTSSHVLPLEAANDGLDAAPRAARATGKVVVRVARGLLRRDAAAPQP